MTEEILEIFGEIFRNHSVKLLIYTNDWKYFPWFIEYIPGDWEFEDLARFTEIVAIFSQNSEIYEGFSGII